ncbi:MAG TPA: hypothetical protein VJT67_16120 [Longimicrobiaceae bacterium]|nr:hypothetical protein [Longimicrobiaceae bacterium]
MRTRLIRAVVAAVVAVVAASAPASAATLREPAAVAGPCVLEPGVYGILDSQGEVVGILIVYPDCRLEVYKRATALI